MKSGVTADCLPVRRRAGSLRQFNQAMSYIFVNQGYFVSAEPGSDMKLFLYPIAMVYWLNLGIKLDATLESRGVRHYPTVWI